MSAYFEITRGLPAPLVVSTMEMFFWEEGNGGEVGFAHASARRNIVMIDNHNVAARFRAHLQRLNGVRFTELAMLPRGVHMDTVMVPTRREAKAIAMAMMQRLLNAIFSSD